MVSHYEVPGNVSLYCSGQDFLVPTGTNFDNLEVCEELLKRLMGGQ